MVNNENVSRKLSDQFAVKVEMEKSCLSELKLTIHSPWFTYIFDVYAYITFSMSNDWRFCTDSEKEFNSRLSYHIFKQCVGLLHYRQQDMQQINRIQSKLDIEDYLISLVSSTPSFYTCKYVCKY